MSKNEDSDLILDLYELHHHPDAIYSFDRVSAIRGLALPV